ncbi:MAG TPA: hypothetical protein VLZ28_09180 [Daejeonella sp.]|nr:hypothetical protein [Daejeonella sp.]
MNYKTLLNTFLVLIVSIVLLTGCEKEPDSEQSSIIWVENSPKSGTEKPLYVVKLENKILNKNKTYTWIWSVTNSKPGDGTPGSGTAKDLLSWGITLGNCASMSEVIIGSTSPDGVTWKNFNPEINTVSELKSVSKPILMFQQGTNKSEKSYYKLVVSRNYSVNNSVSAVYRSSSEAGVLTISGFGCPIN